ncbi:hypothetical protein SCB71_06505 [Herbiconiux sp. KACC 21604]|uniref:hypothetical protein n=1 Tax=unclassified Herbiconiux TaxID=2618217 RepID=UPI0014923100|nr:hypothetical protein [Herbiconiux sp. SALV-R1]QJU52965.1 hypothetical protein HL652_04485 [Herbiconiux sp. SALV-R1]WPO87890.1 hypothetical protein SCB71_06505 [Herbiconiux sp. KACC 21604]
MEWWEWVTWGLAIVTGISGLILGIRAELRAPRYKAHWAVIGGIPIDFINRTEEDATDVTIHIEGASQPIDRTFAFVEAGTKAQVLAQPAKDDIGEHPMKFFIEWTRPLTGKRYRQPKRRRFPRVRDWLARTQRRSRSTTP